MSLTDLLISKTLSMSQLPHDCMGYLLKNREILNIFQILMNLNFGSYRGGASAIGTSV